MTEVIGWASSIILLLTLVKQVHSFNFSDEQFDEVPPVLLVFNLPESNRVILSCEISQLGKLLNLVAVVNPNDAIK
ncbi:MAG: hypothetical protein LH472_06370 [Pyrinomonadaceae bacterium]|nr:hypothetical protein [Pyrinomonadaceae bacterium]